MPRPVIPFEPPYTPEMAQEAQQAIEDILQPGYTVFEYGSGHSTLWLASLGADVVAVEHDPAWHAAGVNALEVDGFKLSLDTYPDIYLVDEADLPHYIAAWNQFDMVIVDCLDRQRVNAIMAARPHVKQGGYLVVDDSHWPILRGVPELLAGWEATTYSGQHTRKTGDIRFHKTTIYKRPVYV